MSLSLPAAATLSRLETFGMRLGLESTEALLAALGSPQRSFPAVLIAGTNGKGSTSALLASIAHHAGLRVGLYTSPHLEAPEERVRIGGEALPSAELSELVLEVVAAGERVLGAPPTYFEAFTAVAFCAFSRHAVDLAVLEVGMGGRLDSTNAADPVLSVITPIALDHQEHLGSTLERIAREKAGILRRARPAVVWIEEQEARQTVAELAAELAIPLEFADRTVAIEPVAGDPWDGQRMILRTPDHCHDLSTALLGEHQRRNVALAVRAAETLRALGWRGIGHDAIEQGVRAVRWPGRLEAIELPTGRRVLLDGAHNPDGVLALERFLDPLGPFDLLFGALADKDLAHMLPSLAGRARRITLTAPPTKRAQPPELLLDLLPQTVAHLEPDLERALDQALADGSAPLLVCGSLYLVGAVRTSLRRRFGVPAAATESLFV